MLAFTSGIQTTFKKFLILYHKHLDTLLRMLK